MTCAINLSLSDPTYPTDPKYAERVGPIMLEAIQKLRAAGLHVSYWTSPAGVIVEPAPEAAPEPATAPADEPPA